MKPYAINVGFDEEAAVYFVESSDVAGLHAEEPTMDAMMATLRMLVPELLEANGIGGSREDVPLLIKTKIKASLTAA